MEADLLKYFSSMHKIIIQEQTAHAKDERTNSELCFVAGRE
jgi:hypothetical protein